MKLLYIGIGAKYINPTNSLLPATLALHNEVVLYGPGYVSGEVLSRGIERFVELHGGFDLVLSSRPNWAMGEADVEFLRRFTVSRVDMTAVLPFANDVRTYLKTCYLPKVLFLTDLDVHAISQTAIDDLNNSGAWFVTWAKGFSRDISDLEVFSKEEFYARKVKQNKLGLWHTFAEESVSRFLCIGHFVAETEFDWGGLEERLYRISVPGQRYVRRREMETLLRKRGVPLPSAMAKPVFSLLDRIGGRPYANAALQTYYGAQFRELIANSKCAYTDGSGYERPIRKFFEIPALGTILMCTPFPGFEKLGFEDRKNALVVDQSNVMDVLNWLERCPEEGARIAAAGRDLIWKNHSAHARGKQLAMCFDAIRTGTYRGSDWIDGQFEVLKVKCRGAG